MCKEQTEQSCLLYKTDLKDRREIKRHNISANALHRNANKTYAFNLHPVQFKKNVSQFQFCVFIWKQKKLKFALTSSASILVTPSKIIMIHPTSTEYKNTHNSSADAESSSKSWQGYKMKVEKLIFVVLFFFVCPSGHVLRANEKEMMWVLTPP